VNIPSPCLTLAAFPQAHEDHLQWSQSGTDRSDHLDTLTATAGQANGAEAKMARNIEVELIPVFQFGDVLRQGPELLPRQEFDFADRVHTNGSLFLAADDPVTWSGNDLHGAKWTDLDSYGVGRL
jgi:hypothetical protein